MIITEMLKSTIPNHPSRFGSLATMLVVVLLARLTPEVFVGRAGEVLTSVLNGRI